jgi:hypothetical protein
MFAHIPEKREYTEFKKVQYLKIIPNVTIRIRILDREATLTFKHYLPKQRVSVVCLGDECPICITNKKLIAENQGIPTTQIRGYIPRSARHSVNVLNRTLVKTAEDGEVVYPDIYGKFPKVSASGKELSKIQASPINRVEVLERGNELFQQLNAYNLNVVDENDNPIGIWNYDIVISATGTGRDMIINVTPQPMKNDTVEVAEEDLYDLKSISLTLSADELWKLLSGVSLVDIFSSRREVETDDEIESTLETAVDESIESLFKD